MKKKHYVIYLIIVAVSFLTLPALIVFSTRYFNLTNGESFAITFPTTMLLFFMLVLCGVLSESIKD